MINEYLLDYIGKTKNSKTIDELRKLASELNIGNYCTPMSIIDISPLDEILQLGMSIPNDLILNNFGLYLAGFIGRIGNIATFVDDGGVTRTFNMGTTNQGDSFNCPRFNPFPAPIILMTCGTRFKLGQGSTLPARSDFKIETDLGSSPEKDLQNTLEGVFNSSLGKVTAAKAYPAAGGNGDITEIGLFYFMGNRLNSPASSAIMMTHDIISPAVNFVVGQTINVELVWQL